MPLHVPAPARRLLRRAAGALLAAVLLPAAGRAQSRTVAVVGYVTDTAAAPVPAAEVLVEGTALVTRTDERGEFRFAALRPGRLTITVRRLGFHSRRDRYETQPGDTLQLILDLVAIPAELAGVTVTGKRGARRSPWLDEFEARRARGFGAFVTRDDIVKRNPLRTSDLFRSITGVSVVPNGMQNELRMARSMTCAPDIYIDGLEARGFRIDDIPPVDIAGIEVFHGPAEVPVRFRRMQSMCGVVSIWTRVPGS
jgi:hypothetical protein